MHLRRALSTSPVIRDRGAAVAAERLGDGVVEDAFLHAGAEVAEDDLREVGRLAGVGAAAEQLEQDAPLGFPDAGQCQSVKRGGEVGEGERFVGGRIPRRSRWALVRLD